MADPKTMVQTSDAVGKTVPVARDASTPLEDNYHDIAGVSTKQMETFSKRMPAIEAALGNKDSVKG